jgi:uncharacterized membrane protein YfcA
VTTLALVAFLGLIGGVLAGMFGVGGGIVYVPVLALGLGLTQLDAEATSLLAILPTVASGVVSHHAYGNVRWRAGLIVGLAGIAGVEVGVLIAQAISEDLLRRLFGGLMVVVALQVAWRTLRTPHNEDPGR